MASSVAIAMDKLTKGIMLEEEDREALREMRRNEVGTEPACPFCGKPRVDRPNGGYIRCNPCGVNWLNEEMHLPSYLHSDPRVARQGAARMESATKPTADMSAAGAN